MGDDQLFSGTGPLVQAFRGVGRCGHRSRRTEEAGHSQTEGPQQAQHADL